MPNELRYRDAIIIGWSLLWRTVGSFLFLLVLANAGVFALLPELGRTSPSWWALLLPLMFVTAVSSTLVMPWVVRRLLFKRFRNFHLEFVREDPEACHTPTTPFGDTRRSGHDTPPRNRSSRSSPLAHPAGNRDDTSRRAG